MEAKDIYAIYPELFREEVKEYPTVKYGIGVGKGWYPILADLVREIREIDEARGTASLLVQVKEKFGGLRFYLAESTNDHWEAISRAESKSHKTCEDCGAPGKVYNDGWVRTLCREDARQRWEKRPEWKADLSWEHCWRHDIVNNSEEDAKN